jgi:hypothetical protein
MAEVAELRERCEQDLGVIAKLRENIKTLLLNQLLSKWKGYLLDRKDLLIKYPVYLQYKIAQTKNFTQSFSRRPGIIRLHIVNWALDVMASVVWLLSWAIFWALILGAGILILKIFALVVEAFEYLSEFMGSR